MTSQGPVAAIDLGTNTCMLLVAARDDTGQLIPLAQEMRVVRLGEGVDRTGRLNESALDRAVAVFQDYEAIIRRLGADQVRCVATSAFREAANGDELRGRLEGATGYSLEEISSDEEARLVLRAVQEAFPQPRGRRVVVDVGGGSTEIILEEKGRLAAVHSLPLGSVRLTERWLAADPPQAKELERLAADLQVILEAGGPLPSAATMVGVGGTATTFVAIDLTLDAYDHSRVHGATLTGDTLRDLIERCATMTNAERLAFPGLHPGRAEVIVAGGLILQAVMERFGLKKMAVSDRGLRWGVVLELAAREG